MSAEDIAATTLHDVAAAAPAPAPKGDERPFHIGLACALALHALLLVGIIGFGVPPHQRRMGEKGGADDGISVVLVDEADFRSRNTVPLEGGRPPAQASAAAQPAEPVKPTPQPAERAPEQPQQKAEPQQQQKQTMAALAKENPDILSIPDLTGKPLQRPDEKSEPKQSPPQQPPNRQPQAKPQTRPNLATPPSQPGENYAAFSRPAGITRSGENDDFARGVIRALRQTMPPGRGSLGRVTIRFLLSDNGNLMEVKVVATSGDSGLTQNVVFASKQSNFPFPPRGATVADRTFLVTYIYD